MSRIWAIFSKEIKSYLLSPISWVVMTGFMALAGITFYIRAVSFPDTLSNAFQSGQLDIIKQNRVNYFLISPVVSDIGMILMFLVPILTMRLFSEEKRMKTEELLLTSPLTVNQIVVAKYLAGLFSAMLLILGSLVFVAITYRYTEPDPGAVATAYAGLVFFVAAIVSIGAFTSSLTENQIVASVSCLIIELLFATMSVASESISSPVLSGIVGYLSFQSHMSALFDGVVFSMDLVFFASFTLFFLFLTNRAVESSRWR